jgi:prefoldin subunit 5
MKTIETVEKQLAGYRKQMTDTQNTIHLISGAIQALEQLLATLKEPIIKDVSKEDN